MKIKKEHKAWEIFKTPRKDITNMIANGEMTTLISFETKK